VSSENQTSENVIRTCVDCQNEFTLEPGEIRFYESRKLQIPKRCRPCRDLKRAANEEGLYGRRKPKQEITFDAPDGKPSLTVKAVVERRPTLIGTGSAELAAKAAELLGKRND
jgi:hypothetical protein